MSNYLCISKKTLLLQQNSNVHYGNVCYDYNKQELLALSMQDM